MSGVCRMQDNALDSRTVPLIFVPGVMGTRLHFTASDKHWDPDDTAGMAWDWIVTTPDRQREDMHYAEPVELYTGNFNEDLASHERDKGWETLSWRSYGTFLRWIADPSRFAVNTPVYAAGYDWRQDLRDLGRHLARRVNAVLEEEEVNEYILVTHSMGGLVSRMMLKQNRDSGLGQNLLGVVHVVQPAVGAPVLYRRFFTGMLSEHDGGWGFAKLLGNTAEKFATVMSGQRGPMQLLPSRYYHTDDAEWLTYSPFEDRRQRQGWEGDLFDQYDSADHPPGIVQSGLPRVVRPGLQARLSEARDALHGARGLGDYKHEQTWAIYSTGAETDTAVHFNLPPSARLVRQHSGPYMSTSPELPTQDRGNVRLTTDVADPPNRGAQLVRGPHGDSTVPKFSGGALFPNQHHACDPNADWDLDRRQFIVHDVEHEPAFQNSEVQNQTEYIISNLLGGC